MREKGGGGGGEKKEKIECERDRQIERPVLSFIGKHKEKRKRKGESER